MASVTIEDPSAVYSQTIDLSAPGSSAALQFVIPLNINDDDLSDFIVHYWRNPPGDSFGSIDTEDTQDALVALVSQPDGTYITDNRSVFGSDVAQLGSASRKYAMADINGDGIDDYAFAMSNEDGRDVFFEDTIESLPAIILSDGRGGFTPKNLGTAAWGHAVDVIENQTGGFDVAFAGIDADGHFEVFRWGANQFQDVTAEYPSASLTTDWGSSFRFFPAESPNSASTAAVGFDNQDGVGLYQQQESGGWELTDRWSSEPIFRVEWVTWTRNLSTTKVVVVDGKQYLDGNIEEIEIFESPTTGKAVVVAKMQLVQLPGVESYDENTVYDQNEGVPLNKLVFFERVGDELRQIESPIDYETIDANYNFLEYKDVNSDGFHDIIVYAFTRPAFDERVDEAGKPIVYLGTEDASFVQVDLSHLPGHSAVEEGAEFQSLFTDVNSDGIEDLMVFGSTGSTFGGDNGDLEIHFLNENSINIDRQVKEDGFYAFDTEGRDSAGAGYRLYKAAFDRTPDEGGMGYWISVLDSGTSLNAIANAFIISDEFASLYGEDPDTESFVTALYNNVLDRDPDAGGLNYWQGLIDGGTLSRAEVLANFSESEENIANTDPLIELGVVYQPYGDALVG